VEARRNLLNSVRNSWMIFITTDITGLHQPQLAVYITSHNYSSTHRFLITYIFLIVEISYLFVNSILPSIKFFCCLNPFVFRICELIFAGIIFLVQKLVKFRSFNFVECVTLNDTQSYTAEEIANLLKVTKFTVYKMISRGDLTGYRIGRKIRVDAADLDAYIRNSKNQSSSGLVSIENVDERVSTGQNELIICGNDIILDSLTKYLVGKVPAVRFLRQHCGSVDGLIDLYRGMVDIATANLWDRDTGKYNVSYVRRMLPGQRMILINLASRRVGFYVAKGNPKKVNDWFDLNTSEVRLVNRECGSGARVLLDEKLCYFNINHREINGYEQEELSHMAVASHVARGEADVGIGIEKVALQVEKIDFIPLQKERCDLVIRKEDQEKPWFQAILSVLQSESFQNEISGIGGYDLEYTGRIIAET